MLIIIQEFITIFDRFVLSDFIDSDSDRMLFQVLFSEPHHHSRINPYLDNYLIETSEKTIQITYMCYILFYS
jgi:hypothetical protein